VLVPLAFRTQEIILRKIMVILIVGFIIKQQMRLSACVPSLASVIVVSGIVLNVVLIFTVKCWVNNTSAGVHEGLLGSLESPRNIWPMF
jgi:hypothetical protein